MVLEMKLMRGIEPGGLQYNQYVATPYQSVQWTCVSTCDVVIYSNC